MKSWLFVSVLFVACSATEDQHHSSPAMAPEPVATQDAGAHGIHVPFERVREKALASQGAFVGQVVGADTWIQISYHRPGVRGRDVWTATNKYGAVVPAGGDPTPWRAGANEATIFAVSRPIEIEGQPLDAGRYVLMFEPGYRSWTLILQDAEGNGGAGSYDSARDVLRVSLAPEGAPHEEWLKYGFDAAEAYTTTAYLHWAETKVPFRISVTPPAEG